MARIAVPALEVAVSGSPRRAARLALPLVAAGLLAAACGNATNDSAAGSAAGSTATPASPSTGGPEPTGTAGPPSGIPAPSGVPVPGATGSSAPGAGTHQLGPADNGKTVTLKVGDTLSVQLPGSGNMAAGRWALATYPKAAVLPKLNNSGLGRFAFQAIAAGGGRITFARFMCSTAASNPCAGIPLPGPKFAPEPPGGRPAAFTVNVQVV